MTKDVLITIKGLQYAVEDSDDQRVETITRGTFYNRNNKNYVTYEESPDGEDTVKSMVKFDETFFELTRKGKFSMHMLFEEGKKNYTDYSTPFGNLVIGIDTDTITVDEKENEIDVVILYDMEMNYEHVAKCRIDVKIQAV